MATGESPSVSVVVPVYNGEETMLGCIESLRALEWPADGLEIVVVDNGSTDSTREIVAAAGGVTLLEEPVRSSYAARNKGIAESSGTLIAFTDADCVVSPRWLAGAAPHFEDESVGAVSGGIESDEPRSPVEKYLAARRSLSNERAFGHGFCPACVTANVVYRRQVFDKVGPFQQRWPSGGDIDMAWRMQKEGGFSLLYEPSASVVHHHRSSLGALYRQRRRMAVGAELLAARWKESGFRSRSRLCGNLANMILKAALVPLTAPLYPFAPGLFWRQLIGVAVRAADIAGRHAGRKVARELVKSP